MAHGYGRVPLFGMRPTDANNPWPHSVVRDDGVEVVIELERLQDYDEASPEELAREASNETWSAWRLVEA